MFKDELKSSPGFYGLVIGAGVIAIISLLIGAWQLFHCRSDCSTKNGTATTSTTVIGTSSPNGTTAQNGTGEDGAAAPWGNTTSTFELTQDYDDTVHHFDIQYPDNALLIDDRAEISNSGYIPACDPDNSVTCIILPGDIYPNSNFGNAGVSVNFLSATNTANCLERKENEGDALPAKKINGITYVSYVMSDAAMSHQSSGADYRTFDHKNCIELTTRIYTSTFEVYSAGSIARFTEQERRVVEGTLMHIVESFSITK